VDRLATVDEEMIDFIDFKDRDVNIRILHTKMGLSVGQSGKKKHVISGRKPGGCHDFVLHILLMCSSQSNT